MKVSGGANTGASGLERATNIQIFDGTIAPSVQYILVDDTFTAGNTLVSLHDFITSNGGNVAAMTTLAAGSYQNYLAARPQDEKNSLAKSV